MKIIWHFAVIIAMLAAGDYLFYRSGYYSGYKEGRQSMYVWIDDQYQKHKSKNDAIMFIPSSLANQKGLVQ